MRTHRKFLCSGALFALLAAACGGQPESAATSQPAAEPAPAAAPAAEQTAQADGDAAPAERPRLVAPVRGEALIGHTRPNTVRRGDNYVTTIRIQNLSDGAVAGFRAEEFWYDANNQPVSGSNTFRARQPLQPGEIVDITLTSPANPAANRNALQFSHANGDVKMELRPNIPAPGTPPADAAAN